MNNVECDAKTQTPIHTHTQTHLSLVLEITLFLTTREWNLSPLCMLFVNMSNGKEKNFLWIYNKTENNCTDLFWNPERKKPLGIISLLNSVEQCSIMRLCRCALGSTFRGAQWRLIKLIY
uniref:Uncharacterized protein n=1 Tax=Rhipicephalus microplus TaxID=6941 RepID=A0A6G5AF71_RHIMP